MKRLLFLIFTLLAGVTYSQTVTTDSCGNRLQIYEEFKVPKNFRAEYLRTLEKVKKVYPLALHAAKVVDSLDTELEKTDKARQEKKIARQTHRELKDDFKFLLKELYVSEGVILTKLIYRETGMTVEEIIAKYKGDAEAKLYTGVAGMFGQDLNSTYDPENEDFIIECVIRDILSGKVEFEPNFEIVDRAHYRADRKEYKERVREYRKKQRELKKKERKAERSKEQLTANSPKK
ncbi:MAG: DUF4294 domain-containing protein [Brumimicrobium sp.]|nr:DUF4294 domain-containing protein [Brumimicrobium sp.]